MRDPKFFLKVCDKRGIQPRRAYSGRFNVRNPPLHAEVVAAADVWCQPQPICRAFALRSSGALIAARRTVKAKLWVERTGTPAACQVDHSCLPAVQQDVGTT